MSIKIGDPVHDDKICIYVGALYSKIINDEKKSINSKEDLNYYCMNCDKKEKCIDLLDKTFREGG